WEGGARDPRALEAGGEVGKRAIAPGEEHAPDSILRGASRDEAGQIRGARMARGSERRAADRAKRRRALVPQRVHAREWSVGARRGQRLRQRLGGAPARPGDRGLVITRGQAL